MQINDESIVKRIKSLIEEEKITLEIIRTLDRMELTAGSRHNRVNAYNNVKSARDSLKLDVKEIRKYITTLKDSLSKEFWTSSSVDESVYL